MEIQAGEEGKKGPVGDARDDIVRLYIVGSLNRDEGYGAA